MAWTGFAVFAAAFGVALVSKDWPPPWGRWTKPLAITAITLFWFVALLYLRFQLHRRRWAALRVAGCERVLADWITKPPTVADLVQSAPKHNALATWIPFVDFFWPLERAVRAVEQGKRKEPPKPFYPHQLMEAWIAQEESSTAAMRHEYILTIATWVLYGSLMARTLL